MKNNIFRTRREEFQNKGRERIKEGDPLYIAGCMLYWGEGSKDKNSVRFTNSDVAMVVLFKKFLKTSFDVKDKDFVLTINCYTDCHSIDEIKNYWFSNLKLDESNLRKCQVNNIPKSSKSSKTKKSEWGTVCLMV